VPVADEPGLFVEQIPLDIAHKEPVQNVGFPLVSDASVCGEMVGNDHVSGLSFFLEKLDGCFVFGVNELPEPGDAEISEAIRVAFVKWVVFEPFLIGAMVCLPVVIPEPVHIQRRFPGL
jgi:hypothetical protein